MFLVLERSRKKVIKLRMTLKKIGELAGVSSACVSNVLNGKSEEYTKETIERVKKVANEYNYRPNSIAKSMVTKSTMTLGLIIPDITNPYFPELAKGVENQAFKRGYNIIYLNSDEDPEKERMAFRTLEQKMVDGVIFIPSVNSVINQQIIKDFSVPIVAVDRIFDVDGIKGEVIANDYLGSRLATNYLIKEGHKHILFLSGDRYYGLKSDRARGFCDEMKENGIEIKDDYMQIGKYEADFGYQAVSDFLKQQKVLDAVYACSDMIAIGALQALRDYNISVPEEVSLVGYDDIYMSQYTHPALTTVCQPKYEMGIEAVEMIIRIINKDESNNIENAKVIIDPWLTIRKSVKCKEV